MKVNSGERCYSLICISTIFIVTHLCFAFGITKPVILEITLSNIPEEKDEQNQNMVIWVTISYVLGILFVMSYIRL
jgi:hypothetical protein